MRECLLQSNLSKPLKEKFSVDEIEEKFLVAVFEKFEIQ